MQVGMGVWGKKQAGHPGGGQEVTLRVTVDVVAHLHGAGRARGAQWR